MASVQLSYLINTRNKLPYLRLVMERLLKNVQPDEEVVVVDGGSADGTREYLLKLHCEGLIHQFLSEPDKSEAHGFNKGLLMAKGELLKIITDDDAFYYPAIEACRDFLLCHPRVDWLGSEGAGTEWHLPNPFGKSAYHTSYERWMKTREPFSFCGLGIMLRRSSLPLLGLFNPGFMRTDAEYSLRVTSGPANLAWYTGFGWVRITNPQSITSRYSDRMRIERRRLTQFYRLLGNTERPFMDLRASATEAAKAVLRPLTGLLRHSQPTGAVAFPTNRAELFERSDNWLVYQNNRHPGQFLFKDELA